MIVAISTWPSHPRRCDYLRRTVEALRLNLRTGEPIAWMVSAESQRADDSPWAGDALEQLCARMDLPLTWRTGRANLPAHLNELLAAAFRLSDCVLYVQDDWELHEPLDIQGAAMTLRETPDLAGIRLWARTRYRDGEPMPGMRDVILRADWSYGDNPALWHRRFWERAGPFPTGGDFGTHEHAMSMKLASVSSLRVFVPAAVALNSAAYFRHIGDVTSVPNDRRWPDAPRRDDPNFWS